MLMEKVNQTRNSVLPESEKRDRMAYTNFVIHEFAEAYKMKKPEGYQYLKKYGGLDYIREHWWALHIDNQHFVMDNIFDICQKNGGYMR